MCTKLSEECYETSSSRGLNFRRGEGACKSLRASDPNIFGATLEHLSTGAIKGRFIDLLMDSEKIISLIRSKLCIILLHE